MNEQKSLYMHRIRSQSAYPFIRTLANVLIFACYSCAVFMLAIGYFFIGKFALALVPIPILLVVVGSIIREAIFIFADIADSITDLNCRYEQPSE